MLLGDGRARGNLGALARELGMQRGFNFTGWVSEPFSTLVAAADAFRYAPSGHERLGNMLLEAGNRACQRCLPGPKGLV